MNFEKCHGTFRFGLKGGWVILPIFEIVQLTHIFVWLMDFMMSDSKIILTENFLREMF